MGWAVGMGGEVVWWSVVSRVGVVWHGVVWGKLVCGTVWCEVVCGYCAALCGLVEWGGNGRSGVGGVG